MTEKSIFSKIIDGEIPADIVHQDEHCIVIRDIQPKAPVHLLIIPREPLPRLADAGPDHQPLLGHLLLIARTMAEREGVADAFRLVVNNGEGAGQTVFHLHIHLLAGTTFSEGELGMA